MTRLLVLDDAGVVIPEDLVDAIESVEPTSLAGPWLPELVGSASLGLGLDGPRRALRLRGGGRIEVPAAMHFVEGVEVLELPELLQSIAASSGVIGLAQLSGALVLVCDPNLLAGIGGRAG
jgi:hypothetical protein